MSQASSISVALSGVTAEPVKILLVDDQHDNLLSAEAVLESLGQQIVKAESGREALRHLLDQDFAVILLDIMMPDMDGFETAALIRQRERSRHTPIIFLTALGRSDAHIRRGYDLGAVDYMIKPIVPEILRSKVSVFVELNRKTAELRAAIDRSLKAEEEIKALNRHLERQVEALNDANHELEAFSYSVSHDLRGPLNRMAGFSQALLEAHAGKLDEQSTLYLQRIDNSARRMCNLVDDLLNFSRLTRVEMQEVRVDLSALVRGLAEEIAARDPQRLAEFVIADGILAWGDATMLHTAMQNLMENSWKFSRHHKTTRIEFGVLDRASQPTYFLRDDGAGFDMADAARLFSPFQRLHKEAEFEGTGIGLALVERIIRRHGGTIWAESAIEHGASFYFTLRPEAGK